MAAVLIDSTILILIGLVVPILCGVGGFFSAQFRVPKPARAIGKAISKGTPILFLSGHDRKLRVVPMKGGTTGYWHDRDLEMIPDEKATYNFYGTEAGIATVQTVSNLNPDFLAYAQAWFQKQKKGELKEMEDVLGRAIGTNPEDLGRAIYELDEMKRDTEDRIKVLDSVISGVTTIEEMAKQKRLDKIQSDKFKIEMDADIKPEGREVLKKKLDKINAARKITVEQDGWIFTQGKSTIDTTKKTINISRILTTTLDDMWALLPTGSNLMVVWTMIKRASMADKLDGGFNSEQAGKWITYAIVLMSVCIGFGLMIYLATAK